MESFEKRVLENLANPPRYNHTFSGTYWKKKSKMLLGLHPIGTYLFPNLFNSNYRK